MTESRKFVPRSGGKWDFDIYARPLGGDYAGKGAISPATALYRFENYIPHVTDMAVDAYRQHAPAAPFTALSVGCSIGAEADTVLSHVTRTHPDIGRVVMRGYDIDDELIGHARRGAYDITYYGDLELLREFDLTPRPARHHEFPHFTQEQLDQLTDITVEGFYVADSNRLRAEHDVQFERLDLSEPQAPGTVPEADLVLCNRVLEHLPFERIEPLVRGMVPYVRPGGILSTGGIPNDRELTRITTLMVDTLGLQPRLWTDWGIEASPFVYQKPLA